jgi:hypothetical protein
MCFILLLGLLGNVLVKGKEKVDTNNTAKEQVLKLSTKLHKPNLGFVDLVHSAATVSIGAKV